MQAAGCQVDLHETGKPISLNQVCIFTLQNKMQFRLIGHLPPFGSRLHATLPNKHPFAAADDYPPDLML